ncbi:MAG: alanine--tRNA ligase [Candidatus Micrarchaeota archaeon]
MLSKENLVREFEQDYKKYYEVDLFRKEGFSRRKCRYCGKAFWSAAETGNCGDSAHNDYTFFNKPKPASEHLNYIQFWKKFSDFWKKNGHEILARYPVISRWRDDLYFTIASIVDFQRLEKGKVVFEYPANPLMVPQPCLRFVDIANVGITGRHLSCFTMAGQHAFKEKGKSGGYWKDECIDLNYKLLTQVMGIPKNEISYGEDLWHMPDFSAFGPSIESFSGGLELVNSVFMQFRATENGKFEELNTRVIDVGWGLERLQWFYNRTPTAFDSVFPEEISFMRKKADFEIDSNLFGRYARLASKLNIEEVHNLREEKENIAKSLGISLQELEKSISPLQAIYAIADHSRTMLFALSDGALPSNSAGGYNLRILLRRAFGFMDEYNFGFDIFDIMNLQAKGYRPLFPELSENLAGIQKILGIERQKYNETKGKASGMASEIIKKGEMNADKLRLLYESHGVTPEILEKVAAEMKIEAKIPADYYRKITERHIMVEKAKKEPLLDDPKFAKLPKTKLAYYDDANKLTDKSKVLAIFGNKVVLDRTIIYPEGGGQAADLGSIGQAKVIDAQKMDDIVLHTVSDPSKLKVGDQCEVKVDPERRMALRRHHSSTHIMIAGCREVLGKHIWQAGAKKEEEGAHLDITHYEKPSIGQLNQIEKIANNHVLDNVRVIINFMDRGAAEKKFGFRLYQGGGAIGNILRVVEYEGVDVEACGGLHCDNSGQVGIIKIVGCEQIQDGVVRIRYNAGLQAIKWIQQREEILRQASDELRVQEEQLPATVKRFFEEWKERGKKLEQAHEDVADALSHKLVNEAKANGKKLVDAKVSLSPPLLEKLALEIAGSDGMAAILVNNGGFVVSAVNEKSCENALELLKKKNAKGGGNKSFARGKIL